MSRMQYQYVKGSSQLHHAVDGNIMGYKAIFVARGFSGKEGLDYEETFVASKSRKHIHDELDEDLNLCYKVEDASLYTIWSHRILVAQEATCHSGTECFQCIKHRRQREYDALEGMTAKDPKARHGTTGWTDY